MGKKRETRKGKIIIYKSAKGPELKVRLEKESVWLTQDQIAVLFNIERSVITRHLGNIFKEGELDEKSNVQKMHIPNSDKSVKFYNLDAIISVGYRVNSKRATQFRVWATKTLKDYIVKGYAINERRLLQTQEKFIQLQKAVTFLQTKAKHQLLEGQSQEILDLLSSYSKSLLVLEQYDTGKLRTIKKGKPRFILKTKDCREIIKRVRKELVAENKAAGLFGQEYPGKFEGIIKGLYQTFGGKELYKSLEEKASHLLYFVIKDHPFVDGNKRIASFLFVYFLNRNNYLFKKSGEKKINDNALVALALLIAISQPEEKNVMINIITNLIGHDSL